ncbi:DUF4191 domain-containing protein [Spongisporangium articulatum]|uniref:DUF4191 domain-containing protein n=1 Tax=Spongisporangium articulatum TaxID=3362603 RepID=A0ABW8AT13_9ACTN
MARNEPAPGVPTGRFAQIRAVFGMVWKNDKPGFALMIAAWAVTLLLGILIGAIWDHAYYGGFLGFLAGLLAATVILGRRAETVAFSQVVGMAGATGYALKGLRRGWNVDEQPVQVDPRTQDLVFRAVGRPGVVLVTEGPLPRVNRLAETERKRMTKVLPDVPVIVLHAGDDEGQVPLRKLTRTIMRKRPVLTKDEVSTVAKRLHALGAARLPIPKGVDPTRMRPDRKATRGR